MNTFIKNTFIFALGAATGAFVAIKLLEDHYAAIADEEIEEAKNITRKKIDDLIAKYEGEIKKKEVSSAVAVKVAEENVYKTLARDYTKPDLNSMAAKYDDAENEYPRDDDDEEYEDELEEMEAEAKSIHMNERDDVEPYLITEEEFASENLHYEKLTLWYYEVDKTLADDNEEIIDNVEQLIGEETLDMIDDERTIYIRNDRQGSDFEINCLNKSYKEEVVGIIEEDN